MRMESGSRDQFPVGMRVLAVDDDPTCLRLLERLLIHCKYHVTTTNQAIRALELLRGNKDDFDLVISDVHMPDMDGFKLLELIGLEMDLPVIMLSANSEYQNVMKGITHGACDYLVKPVRVEELRNVWQHVIRRKKFDAKDQNNSDSGDEYERGQTANSEGGQDPVFSGGASDRNEKLSKKRKDQNGEDEDDCEENSNENEDPTTQKKPRVVWSIELHRKFVVAVNQLGIDKAVPKKILDLMNVERLTRENVASHLQKYRLYLKRLSAVATQQANMVSSFGGRNSAYHPMGSLEGFRNFHPLMGSRQSSTLSSLQPNGALSRMSSSTGFGLKNMLTTSRTAQHGLILNNTSNNVSELGNLQGIGLQGSQHLQRHKTLKETNNRLPGSFSGGGHSVGSSSKLVTNMTSNPLIMQANQQSLLSGALPSASSDSLKAALRDPPGLPNLRRCNDTWQGDLPLNQYSANSLSVAALSSHNNLYNVSPITSIMDPVASLGNPVEGNSVQQTSACDPNLMFSYNLSSSLPNLHVANSTSSSSMLRNGFANGKMDMTLNGQNSGASLLAENGMTDCQDNYKEGFALEKLHGEFSSNGCSFDELANAFSKPDQGDANFFDGDMASDIYSLGTCM